MNPAELRRPSHKVLPLHLDKRAAVYVRQSTPHQVAENRESADLQYQLVRRAVELGWPEPRVLVIDEDQGKSGQSADNRPGFQRLLAEISLGHVGIVLGREMSRLARSCKDWYQLLELCGLFHVLLADADGVYDPAEFNDRLLLGLKGTMSEAELHVLKTRMHHGRLNKARRGELFTCVPVGYVRAPEGGIAHDPDEQVRAVVRLILAKFAELGSVSKVHDYLVANDVRVGLRAYKGPDKGTLAWHRPRRRTVYEILCHPMYAGAYAYGRHPTVRGSAKGRRTAPPEEWVCLLRDKVPAYITWDQYQANRRRLRENALYRGSNRATGRSPTLLNGIVRCGRCGGAVAARNARVTATPRYVCDAARHEFADSLCQGVSAAAVDRLIESLVLRAVEPAALELSLRAAGEVERDRGRLHEQWKQKLERVGYEVARAKRQYDAVDPENRLVARELERQWEAKLADQREIEEGYARFRDGQPQHLSGADRDRIRRLATDVPALWRAATTTGGDRRAVIRQLIERVTLSRREATEVIDVVVHWRGVGETRHVAVQGTHHYEQLADVEQLRDRVQTLRGSGQTAEEIATTLNAEGYRPSRGPGFNANRVRHLFVRWRMTDTPSGSEAGGLPGAKEWWLADLARELGVEPMVVHQWRWYGWLHARQLPGKAGRVIVWADRDEVRRLRRLRAYEVQHRNQRGVPAELTTPKERGNGPKKAGRKKT